MALLVCLGGDGFANDAKTPDEARPDSRLDQRITISTAYDSLQEFCAKLRGLTGAAAESGADASEANGRPQRAAPTREANPSAPVPVEITCDPAIKEHKVVVRVKDQPLREVMRQIAVLFDFTWMQGPQEHPRYHLLQSGARARRGEELRRRLAAERESRVRQVFRDILAALVAAPDELTDLAKTDADAAALAVTQPEAYGLLLALDDRAMDDVLSGREVVAPFAELPPEVQERINSRFSGRSEDGSSRPPQPAGGYVRYRRDDQFTYGAIYVEQMRPHPDTGELVPNLLASLRPRADWSRLQYQQQFLNEGAVTSEGTEQRRTRLALLHQTLGIDLDRKVRDAAKESVPDWARPAAEAEAQPDRRLIPLQHPRAALPVLLLDVAETLDLNLVADCYWTDRDRQVGGLYRAGLYPALLDQEQQLCIDGNPEYVLKRISDYHLLGWAKDDGIYRVRHLLWFLADPEEVPASAIGSWLRRTHDEEHIALEDYVDLLNRLSRRHWENLGYTNYVDPESPEKELQALRNVSDSDYDPLKLFTLLTPQERSLAQTTGIAVGDFPERLQPLMMALLGQKCLNPDRTDAPAIPVPIPEVRFFAGYRARDTNQPQLEEMEPGGPYPSAFYIELWAGGAPDWGWLDTERDHPGMYDKGRIEWWSYALKGRTAKAAKE